MCFISVSKLTLSLSGKSCFNVRSKLFKWSSLVDMSVCVGSWCVPVKSTAAEPVVTNFSIEYGLIGFQSFSSKILQRRSTTSSLPKIGFEYFKYTKFTTVGYVSASQEFSDLLS